MQTHISAARLATSPALREAESILRKCVHCGFCTATCPTFVLRGDELDSPRGRIYLIKSMLERDVPASDTEVTHIDRCLTCLSCMTTCPSGVDYAHLVEHAREHIEHTYRRPLGQRLMRRGLKWMLPHGSRFRLVMQVARLGLPLAGAAAALLPAPWGQRLRAMLAAVPATLPAITPGNRPGTTPASGQRRLRIGLHTGCVQPVLEPQINEAIIRLLTRFGCEVVVSPGVGCCGAVVAHMGDTDGGRAFARANITAWEAERQRGGLDAIIISASGCGSTVKDYGHLLKDDPQQAEAAARIAGLARDLSEVLLALHHQAPLPPPVTDVSAVRVAYHAACSLQHGQKIKDPPKFLLKLAGFEVQEPKDPHLCCGSAGTYSLLQPDLSQQLRARKVATLEATTPQVVATGNIGCLRHIGDGTALPVVHTAELLDWAWGGPRPAGLG